MIVSLSVDVIRHTLQKFSHPLQSPKFDNAQYLFFFFIFLPYLIQTPTCFNPTLVSLAATAPMCERPAVNVPGR